MQNAFEILAGFLDRSEGEVEGRALEKPPAAVQVKLREFARGALPAAEQEPLLVQLRQNRHWIAQLAEEVKALRTRSPNQPPPPL